MVFRKSSRKFGRKRAFKKVTFKRQSSKSLKKRRVTAARPLSTKVSSNTTKLNRVMSLVKTATSTHKKVEYGISVEDVLFGEQSVISLNGFYRTQLERALARLQSFNASSPATLVAFDGRLGNFERHYRFTKLVTNLEVQNQGFVAVTVRVYEARSKVDTSITAAEAMEDGLANQLIDYSTGASDNIAARPHDTEFFNSLWQTSGFHEFTLHPGQKKEFSASLPGFDYSPATADDHALLYIKGKNLNWLVLLQGDITTDSTATFTASSDIKDIVLTQRITTTVEYNGSASLRTIEYVSPSHNTSFTAFNQNRPTTQKINTAGAVVP